MDINNIDANISDTTIPLVISFENNFKENVNSHFFKQTLDKLQWHYQFIGEGMKWQGVRTKIYAYYDYLQKLPNDKIVVLTDSRDVICTRGPISFISAIKNIDINQKIIISAEMFLLGHIDWSHDDISNALLKDPNYFWQGIPINNYWKHHDVTPIRKYVNSGLIIGKVSRLIKVLEWIIQNKYTDDQLGFSCYTNNFPENVYVDHSADLLHTSTYGVDGGFYDKKQKLDSPTFSELFQMSSYFLHIPGLAISKGQQCVYNLIKKLLESNMFDQSQLLDLYNIKLNSDIDYHFFIKNNR